jgi:dimethylargininase
MFQNAIVKRPCQNMVMGLHEAALGSPDINLALKQHDAYIEALIQCGLKVTVLPAEEEYPDSVFIEDTALLTPRCAIITHPGAPSRRGETVTTRTAVSHFYKQIETITPPDTVDAGDIMMVGNHFYIGLSQRTTQSGADQLIGILMRYAMTGSTVSLNHVLHLKTGVVYLENNTLVTAGEFVSKPEFSGFKRIVVPPEEQYAGNCVWINDQVLLAAGYPRTRALIEAAGYRTIPLDMSEYRKLDGGLSCLSLRF